MCSIKRALLIASPYGGLCGPNNDVEAMAEALERYAFEVKRCCGENATRDGILAAWKQIIAQCSANDTVVIYYSGHGALVESKPNDVDQREWSKEPWRSQFIVPMDYDETTENDFRGILDVEMSHMLRDTTEKTHNVTIILDCCHSSRLCRDPHHKGKAWPKNLPKVQHHNILLKHAEQLRRDGRLREETFLEGNPYAVRVSAAAATEAAWEYENAKGQPIGALTEALTFAINKLHGQPVSWRTTLLGVSESVNIEFPQQHPRVEGPEDRILFSTELLSGGSLLIKMEDDEAIIQGGRVAGVMEGNVYAIMPLDSERVESEKLIAKAKVTGISGFKATAELISGTTHDLIPSGGALAFLQTESLYRFPASFPEDFPALQTQLEKSKFLKCYSLDEEVEPLVEFLKEEGRVIVRTNRGVQLASHHFTDKTLQAAVEAAVRDAERLARAQHLLKLESGTEEEALHPTVEIEFGLVHNGHRNMLKENGEASVTEKERVYVSLRNKGDGTVFVSVFDVNVAGKVTLISESSPRGIELGPGRDYTLGKDQFGGKLKGLELSWPVSVPKIENVDERIVFVISSLEVDLRHLADTRSSHTEARGDISSLERLTYHISYGGNRDIGGETRVGCIPYAVEQIPFTLRSKSA
jgi:hypothetical protein